MDCKTRQLAKDLTIAVVDGGRGIGNGRVMPGRTAAGAARLPARADRRHRRQRDRSRRGAAGDVTDWLRLALPAPCCARASSRVEATDWLTGARVVAWAGIGAPQRFFATLQALGADVVEAVTFRDHQQLSEDDARRLLDLARRHSATLVTTQKDMTRLAGAHGPCGELRGTARVLPVRLTFAIADAERLMSLVATVLQTPRG